jgi:hypothetical protein
MVRDYYGNISVLCQVNESISVACADWRAKKTGLREGGRFDRTSLCERIIEDPIWLD